MCSEFSHGDERGWSITKPLLLELLSHGSEAVQTRAYQSFQAHMVDGLVKEAGCSPEACFTVIQDGDVMRELCCSGLISNVPEVLGASCALLSALSCLKDTPRWAQLRSQLLPRMAYIEACGLCMYNFNYACSCTSVHAACFHACTYI